ncbi:MAG: hypothetical protein HC850_00705 [Rhodomicrobium sp.]|nr:hypothetical protein [Rhodomicrobium sp.]
MRLHLALGQPAAKLDQPVGQRRFAVVDMGDDGKLRMRAMGLASGAGAGAGAARGGVGVAMVMGDR